MSSRLDLPEPDSSQISHLRNQLASRFDLGEKHLVLAREEFAILKVKDANALVDAIDPATFADDERLPYWADIWTSSLELARLCLSELDLRDKRLLELGCGLGLAGIAATRAGAFVTFSDYEQDALDFSRYNALLNLTPEAFSRTEFLQLDWRSVGNAGLPPPEEFDMIIAADVVYERRNFFPLIGVMQQLLKRGGVVVLTEPGRSIGEYFFNLLREERFDLTISSGKVEFEGKSSSVIRAFIEKPEAENALHH